MRTAGMSSPPARASSSSSNAGIALMTAGSSSTSSTLGGSAAAAARSSWALSEPARVEPEIARTCRAGATAGSVGMSECLVMVALPWQAKLGALRLLDEVDVVRDAAGLACAYGDEDAVVEPLQFGGGGLDADGGAERVLGGVDVLA